MLKSCKLKYKYMIMKTGLIFSLTLFVFLSAFSQQQLPRVSVKGNRFIADGKPVIFHGVSSSDPEKSPDEVLDDITLYWLPNTATSAGRLYWEAGPASPAFSGPQMTSGISLPVAITVFPGENYRAPETWARRAYRNLSYFHEVDKGGHFAAWEEPQLFSVELRAAFRPLRQ